MYKPKVYVKDVSSDPIYKATNKAFYFRSKIYPTMLFLIGIALLSTQVVIPVILIKYTDEVKTPVTSSVLGIASGFRDFEFAELEEEDEVGIKEDTEAAVENEVALAVESEAEGDIAPEVKAEVKAETKDAPKKEEKSTVVPEIFYLTVPKLDIVDAVVETNSASLNPDLRLGHYKGSALPGERGNAFIYGHSVLRWFYNPKNYKSIFSTLDTLEIGDAFYIKYNDQELKYKVSKIEYLSPSEVNPLGVVSPKFLNESTTTLMTCAPPGTKIKRLLVSGVMVPLN